MSESMTRLDRALAHALSRWVAGVHRRAGFIAWSFSLLAILLGVYAVLNLGINSDHTRVLDDDVPSQQAQKEFARLFPSLDNALIVVVDGDQPERTRLATDRLIAGLRSDPEHFGEVYEPGGGAFFTRNGLLYRSVEDLEDFADQMVEAQPLLAELEREPSLARMSELIRLGLASAPADVSDAKTWSAVLDQVSDAAVGVYAEYPVFISWEDLLLRDTALEVEPRRVVMVQPVLDYDALLPAGPSMEAIRLLADDLEPGVRVRVTGNPALNHEEMFGLAWDIGGAGIFCFLLVAGVLYRALRSMILVIASLVTLLAGLFWTAAFAAVSVGQVNLVSICFAVLFIGLGVDFSIHLAMQYAAFRRGGSDHLPSLQAAARGVGSSLVLCAFTTAIGFFVFVPTDYRGVAELGLISGVGMFVMLFLNLTYLPALLSAWLRFEPRPGENVRMVLRAGVTEAPARYAVPIRWVAAGLAVVAVWLVPGVRFDPDVVRLRDPDTASVQAFADLLDDNDLSSPWFANVLAGDLAEADALAERFRALPDIGIVVTLSDFVPEQQEEKREILRDLSFVLDVPPAGRDDSLAEPDSTESVVAALVELRDFLDGALVEERFEARSPLTESAVGLRDQLDVLLARIEREGRAAEALEQFETILLGTFPDLLERLRAALEPEPVALASLPEELEQRMIAADGRVRIQIYPKENLNRELALRSFVENVRSVREDAIGLAVNLVEFGRVTVDSLRQALISALLAITLLLWLLWRQVAPVVLVLAPLILGAFLTVATMVLLDMRFNFANVIVIPLLFGMGVDSGIHLVHRARGEGLAASELMATPTARAVFYSALTTVVSFGSLALSSHRGMASLGQTLVIGLVLTLFANLVVLPALLVGWRRAPADRNAESLPVEAPEA